MTAKKFPTLKVEPNGVKEIQTKELIEKGLENASQ